MVVREESESILRFSPYQPGSWPFSLAVDDGAVWVLNTNGGTVMRIEPTSGKVTGAAIRVGNTPFDLAVKAGSVWITNGEQGRLLRIDAATGEVQNELPVVGGPFAAVVGMGSVWVTGNFDGTLTRIDPYVPRRRHCVVHLARLPGEPFIYPKKSLPSLR